MIAMTTILYQSESLSLISKSFLSRDIERGLTSNTVALVAVNTGTACICCCFYNIYHCISLYTTVYFCIFTVYYCIFLYIYCILTVYFCIFTVYYCTTVYFCIFTVYYCIFLYIYCILTVYFCIFTVYYCTTVYYCIFTVYYCILLYTTVYLLYIIYWTIR